MDHNSTTPLDHRVRDKMWQALELVGNPSSIHKEGRAARHVVESARRSVAHLCAATPESVVFTSGGTEADCLGIIGLARLARLARARAGLARGSRLTVVSAAIEHPAVHGALGWLAAQGMAVEHVAVDGDGVLDLHALERLCARGVAVVAVSLANHELGTVQDIAAVSAMAHDHGALVHCDAVQAAGKMAIDVADLGVDTLAISAHKFHGPKGVGALLVRDGIELEPLFAAGHQERERRPGTENLVGIAGMGEAAILARRGGDDTNPGDAKINPGDAKINPGDANSARVRALALRLERGLCELPGVRIHGAGATRVGNTVNAGFDGALGQVVVAALDIAGFAVSTGAACTSGTVEPSPVLLAIGLPVERALEAVRFSLGRDNSAADIDAVLAALPAIIERARQFR